MKNKRLLHLMEHINQAYIEEAAPQKTAARPAWKRWGAIAAAFLFLMSTVIGGYYIFQKFMVNDLPDASVGNKENENIVYMDYNGPVLPLTASQNLENITVERLVQYDFSDNIVNGTEKAKVIDQYVLHNTSDQAQTVSLIYPFGASLSEDADALPKIIVSGTVMETGIYPGAQCKLKKTGKTGEQIGWQAYQELLADGSYREAAFADYPELNQSVIVYEITDYICNGKGENPTLSMEFQMDYNKTTVITYGMNGAKNNVKTGEYSRSFSVPLAGEYGYGESYYLVVLGEDLTNYTLQGYKDGGCDKGEEISITATVNRIETTLGAFLQERLEEKRIPNSSGEIRDAVSDKMFFGLVAQQMQDGILAAEGTAKFNFDMFEDSISSAHYAQRVIYLTFDVTIPAGEQIAVDCSFVKEAHSDYVMGAQQGYAYDVATQLGSSLVFTSQKASICNVENVKMIGQNFGFDLEQGVTQTTLQNDEVYYWIELRKK